MVAYRDRGECPLPSNEASRLDWLASQPEATLRTPPELQHWERGIPQADLPNAWGGWRRCLDEWTRGPQGGEQHEALLARMLQLNRLARGEERVELLERTFMVMSDDNHRTIVAGLRATEAAKQSQPDVARRWLARARASPTLLLADSSYRVARAALALSERDGQGALVCLGDRPDGVRMAALFRVTAQIYRPYALSLARRHAEADAALLDLVQRLGILRAYRNLTEHPWPIDRGPLERHVRASVRPRALLITGIAVLLVGAAVALSWTVADYEDGPRLVGWLFSAGLILLASRVGRAAIQRWGLTQRGKLGFGKVIDLMMAMSGDNNKQNRYLQIEATIDEMPLVVRSVAAMPLREAEQLLGGQAVVLWDERRPERAAVIATKAAPR